MTASQNWEDVYKAQTARIAELEKALQRSLSWLSSYPGDGALGCYEQARAALDTAVDNAMKGEP